MRITRRAAITGAGALILTSEPRAAFIAVSGRGVGPPSPSVAWQPLSIGGGGLVIGNDVATDGTRICWGDVFGLYLWNSSASKWVQTFTSSNFSSADWLKIWDAASYAQGGGCWGAGICAGNSQIIYAHAGYNTSSGGWFWVSQNQGSTWTMCGSTIINDGSNSNGGGSGSNRFCGPHMCVDPQFANRFVYASKSTGVWTTSNGLSGASATISQISTGTIPANDTNCNGCVIIDGNSGTNGSGFSNKNYVSVSGSGLYVSQDGGTTWTLVSGSPTEILRMSLGADGRVYFVDGAASGSGSNVYMLSWSGSTPTITNIKSGVTLPASFSNVVPNLGNVNQIVLFSTFSSMAFQVGNWNGSSWVWATENTSTATFNTTSVPWHSVFWPGAAFCYTAKADPSSNTILMSNYQSIVTTQFPMAAAGTGQAYVDIGLGIEECVCNQVIIPPGGSGTVIVAVDDLGAITVNTPPNTPPSTNYQFGLGITPCRGLDYASIAPNFIVGSFGGFPFSSGSGGIAVSSDYGTTWTPVTRPSANFGGLVAATSTQNLMFKDSSNLVWFSKNGGSTWTQTTTIGTGFFGPAADRVTDGTFYFFQEAATPLLWVTTDSGTTWNSFAVGSFLSWMTGGWGALLRAVPGNAGHLFIRAFGGPPFPQHQPWARLIFNGTTCTAQSATLHNVFDFGFGQAASGATYPALYAQGWNAAETQMATWRSIDTTASAIGTFQELTSTNPDGGTFGDGWLDSMGPSGAVAASMDTYGLVVTGTQGSTAQYGLFP